MKIFPWKKQKDFFSEEEKSRILEAIQKVEQRTSGEIRIFIEPHCRYVDAIDRAKEIFFQLGMEKTGDRNATLIYVAPKDKQAAVYGDEGIHRRVGQKYWEDTVNKMLVCFQQAHLADGLIQGITMIGEALYEQFPYDHKTDKNELPDDIIFGS